jgi:hypothetical protein
VAGVFLVEAYGFLVYARRLFAAMSGVFERWGPSVHHVVFVPVKGVVKRAALSLLPLDLDIPAVRRSCRCG